LVLWPSPSAALGASACDTHMWTVIKASEEQSKFVAEFAAAQLELLRIRTIRAAKIQKVIEKAGIQFTDDGASEIGVRLQLGNR